MSVTAKTPLGAATTVRKWWLQVNAGTYASPVWTHVLGITELKPALEPTLQDDSDMDSEGYKSQTVTALAWAIEAKLIRKVTAADAEAYDAGQEILREAAEGMGVANKVDVRWFEMEDEGPREEAYRGYAAVSWSPDGGTMDALDSVSVTLTGKGKRTAITHPSPKS